MSSYHAMRRLAGLDPRWPGFLEDADETGEAKLSRSLDRVDKLLDQAQKAIAQAADELRPHGRNTTGDVGAAVAALHTSLNSQGSATHGLAASLKNATTEIRALLQGAKPKTNLATWKAGW